MRLTSPDHFPRPPTTIRISSDKYILVAMNYFSKWPEAFTIANQKTSTVAQVLVNNLVCRFEVPPELLSDQGCDFESRVFQGFCRSLGITENYDNSVTPTVGWDGCAI